MKKEGETNERTDKPKNYMSPYENVWGIKMTLVTKCWRVNGLC